MVSFVNYMRLRLKILMLVIALSGLFNSAFAQETIKGIIFRRSSDGRVSEALIKDLKNQVIMMSDDLGMFSITASPGDTLLATKKGYAPEKIVIVDRNDITIYMDAVRELAPVTVKGKTEKQELKDVMKQYKSDGVFNDGKSLPFWQFVNSPITGLYNLFGKSPAEARRFAAFSKNELEANEVDKRYTKDLVKRVTKLPDDEILKFMDFYRPSYQDIKEWDDYQLIIAIKKNLVYYQRTKNHQPPPPQKLY
jgi:hypothetical protein